MKFFFKNAFSTVFGIFIFFIIGIILILIIFFSINFWKKTSFNKIKKKTIIEITFDEKVIENSKEVDSNLLINWEDSKPISLKEQIDAIKKAKYDTRIEGISIKLENPIDIGITQIREFHNALLDFKKSKKIVFSYLNNATQKSYYLSSISDKIYLNPTSIIEFFGLSSEIFFLKDFSDKYGIKFNIIRNGKYKSAVEPFFRNEISKENKEQISQNLQDIWGYISQEIAKYRQIPINLLNKIVYNLYSMIPNFSLKYHLIDKLVQESEYYNIIKKKIGVRTLNIISLKDYYDQNIKPKNQSNKIAILYFSGNIMEGDNSIGIKSEFYKNIIRDIRDDNTIKSVVLRINSPGGSAQISNEIFYELNLLKKKKPIVSSFGDIAASGAYYIAMVSDSIFAYPTTITGSIGVLGMMPDVKEFINKLGVKNTLVQTHPNSYFYSPTYGLSPAGKKILKQSIDNIYKDFIKIVAKNRKKSFSYIHKIAQGRIWSGKQALKIGLIDKFGDLNYAIKSAALLANLKSFSINSYPNIDNSFFSSIKNFSQNNKLNYEFLFSFFKEKNIFWKKIEEIKYYSGIMMIDPIEIKF